MFYLPAQLDSHGSQIHEIIFFLWEQFLFHETPQEESPWTLTQGQKDSLMNGILV
jgi:hypothetical protein